ncbi:28S ribosomal protein S29, mitochondrial [Geodia barretti]|uniref:Small ribosomal subunit protein mS29 n=1 Tax=Geodia barretti TaxID=519541 RepID=A0AA35R6E4_GEOBA|nr:28S ribosomal protein S29, mitochondrial [Geodia barretti]
MLRVSSRSAVVRSLLSGIRRQSTKDATVEDWTINPLELGEENVSHMYCVPSGDVKTVFPTSLPSQFSTQTTSIGEMCWILRRQSYQMMQELKSFDATQPHNFRYLLYGADGSGKTICLHQVLHYCVKAGWLVVFVPGVFSWTHSDRELRPSTRVPGTFDQPDTATAWLKAFRTLNSHFTSQVLCSV